ncbi:MAG: hypothetical protein ABH823_05640 [bacterium]
MKNMLLMLLVYTLALASSQILLKAGANQIGNFNVKSLSDVFPLILAMVRNPFVLLGTLVLASSYLLWIYMLSWFKLGLIFPLSALAFIFVAILSYFLLGERFSTLNYCGMLLIFGGLFFLLYK